MPRRESTAQPYVTPFIPAINPFVYTAGQPSTVISAGQKQKIQDDMDYAKAIADRDFVYRAGAAKAARDRNSYSPPKQEWWEKLANTAETAVFSALPFLFL